MSNSITDAGYLPAMAPSKSNDKRKDGPRAKAAAARAAREDKKRARAELRKARASARKARRGSTADDAETETELPDTTYTIDELSAHSGVPSRTIRFYQAQKILDRPIRKGRVAHYTDAHAERLELIQTLQDRGLRIRGMKQLLARPDADAAVRDWLGLSAKLAEPWTGEQPRVMTEDEMADLLADRPAGTLAAIVGAGLAERPDDAPHSYFVASPGLLDVALQLLDAGVSIDVLAELEPILRDGLRTTARDVVEYVAESLDENELAGAIDALRTLGTSGISIIFAQEVEKTVNKLLEGGARPRSRKNRKSRRRRRR
jgi:DNA-binding transcriptional MerR regulator